MGKDKKDIVAIFPGSFDPFTKGHVDIAERSMRLFAKLYIAVLQNPIKEALFSVQERTELIQEAISGFEGEFEIDSFSGLLVDYAKTTNADVIVRGLRAVSDYEYESQMALMNRNISGGLETVFLLTSEQNSYISSSMVKQVAKYGGDVSSMVTPPIHEALKKKFSAS